MKSIFTGKQPGLTMIEILVSVAMASMVFIITGSLLALFVTQNSKNVRQEKFEQAKNDLTVELSDHVKWGKEVTFTTDSLTIDENVYKVSDGAFLKNDEPFISSSLAVTDFKISDLSTNPEIVGLVIEIEIQDRNYPLSSDLMRLVVSQRRTEIAF